MTVYFAVPRNKPEGPVKIGYTSNVVNRISNLNVAVPGGLMLLTVVEGGIDTEDYIHERFAHCRETGEWFRLTDDLRQFIQDVQNKVPGIVPFVEPTKHIARSPAEIANDCMVEAKEMLAFLLGQEFRGPGDTIGAAIARLELKTGIPRSISMRVRHRLMSDMLVSNYFVVKEAYDAAVAQDNSKVARAGAILAGKKDGAE